MINRLKPTTQTRVSAERETSEFSFSSTCRFPSQLSHRLHPWVGKIPWKRKWQSTPVFFPGKSHGQRSLAGYSLWGCKDSDTTEQLSSYTLPPLHRFAWRVGLTLAGVSTILHFKYNPVYNPDKDLADFQLRECRKDVSSGE